MGRTVEQAMFPVLDQNAPWFLQERLKTAASVSLGISAHNTLRILGALLSWRGLAPSVLHLPAETTSVSAGS